MSSGKTRLSLSTLSLAIIVVLTGSPAWAVLILYDTTRDTFVRLNNATNYGSDPDNRLGKYTQDAYLGDFDRAGNPQRHRGRTWRSAYHGVATRRDPSQLVRQDGAGHRVQHQRRLSTRRLPKPRPRLGRFDGTRFPTNTSFDPWGTAEGQYRPVGPRVECRLLAAHRPRRARAGVSAPG